MREAYEDGVGARLSVIVPFHRNLQHLRQCLQAIRRARAHLPQGSTVVDVIVAADGAMDNPEALVTELGATLIEIAGPRGPAVARDRAADVAAGDILVFVDADVVIEDTGLGRFAELFRASPDVAAAFGAYDEAPADPDFLSQCRNLAHSYVHQSAHREATTFWAGLGAVRADVFREVGGFDERFGQPSVEDIDLGYRISAAGYRIILDSTIRGTHLKRWTFRSSVVSDIRDRGVPWTQLLRRNTGLHNDLNVSRSYRVCVVLAYILIGCLAAAPWVPVLFTGVLASTILLWALNREYYRFFTRQRGLTFTIRWFPLHVLHHLCNGLSFAIGMILFLSRRYFGLNVPGTLPLSTWSPALRAQAGSSFER